MPNKIANRRKAALRAVIVGLGLTCAGALVACMASAPQEKHGASPRTMADVEGVAESGGDVCSKDVLAPVTPQRDRAREIHAEIQQRMAAITSARKQAHLPDDLARDTVERMAGYSVQEARAVCELSDGSGALCSEVCKLADSICDNAESICRLADELDGDEWANSRCQHATTSCGEARERCCGCT